ncbi:MAG TPA: hypothetical protein VH867_05860 [Burkholderiales bacterium]
MTAYTRFKLDPTWETIARLLARLRSSAESTHFTRERLAAHEKTDVAAAQAALARLDECECFSRSKSREDRER